MSEDFYFPDARPPLPAGTEERDLRGKKIRLWIIGFLLLTGFVFLGMERYTTQIKPKLALSFLKNERISVLRMEEDYRQLLENYAIDPRSIRKTAVNLPVCDSVRLEWYVPVPRDLPVAMVTHDMNGIAARYDGKVYAVEDTKAEQVTIHTRANRRILYSVIFQRSAAVRRASGSICVMVDGIEDAPSAEVDRFLAMTDPVGCVLQARRDSRAFYSRLVERNKEIILHLHFLAEKESESKFELSEDLPAPVIAARVKSIQKEFPRAAGYYLTSERSSTDAMRVAEDALAPAAMRKIPTVDIEYVDRGSTFNQMSSRMNDIADIAANSGRALGVLELRDGTTAFLEQEITRLQKRGFGFVSFTRSGIGKGADARP